jgi:4-hydroxybenzoate polyprenyltransferase
LINKILRDVINLLLYGGGFIGLCAACITALSFELTGRAEENLHYILFIGTATAALYAGHRVIGLKKVDHINSSERYAVIRKYKVHIWIYCILWILLSLWLFLPMASVEFVLWLLPGGFIAGTYVIPFLPGSRRLRDLGWWKILLIGWSWGWLTAFIPLWHFANSSIQLSIIHGLERMLFIIAITIPFEIRDLHVDQSIGLTTLPEKLGKKKTMRIALILCICIVLFSAVASFHYFNLAYVYAMMITCLPILPFIHWSYSMQDDYFYGGLTDGLMIFALLMYVWVNTYV